MRWQDTSAGLAKAATMTGLEQIQAMMRGELPSPPIGELMGIYGISADEGKVVVGVEPAEYHANGTGAAHGGLAATLLDSAMWLAIHSTMPVRSFASTLQMNVNYVRPIVLGGGAVIAEGRVLHRGRTVVTAEGDIKNPAGKICAHATTTCTVVTF